MRFLGVAVGGALGAVLRWWLGDLLPTTAGFPWVTFAINVSGSAALAALPLLSAVRRSPALTATLGSGLLGGYTTLSAYSEQARALLDAGRTLTALAYLIGTLAACLVVVALISRAGPERPK
ncbi:CrcB family protein [Nocardioides anomalus]|uniref:Fluoride-specific ion channel FluC n=1 Tax=Nocardioides anomalus TaxID=2712223 RepID=A0A6G6WK61_9ACTN|nr:CrcB family protein [Nocardioides anomalus]QIG45586.1 CrcB family protein [Nocardioides anomalus]